MVRKRKPKPEVVPLPVPETDAQTVFLDDFRNADWPKQTDDTHEAIFRRIEEDRARDAAAE